MESMRYFVLFAQCFLLLEAISANTATAMFRDDVQRQAPCVVVIIINSSAL